MVPVHQLMSARAHTEEQEGPHQGEEDEVLEASVEVGLLIKHADLLEVRVVDVGVHTEKALVDGLGHLLQGYDMKRQSGTAVWSQATIPNQCKDVSSWGIGPYQSCKA